MKVAREVERDCELRAIKCINKFLLPIDIDIYIKKAGGYLYFYTTIPMHG